jgi:NitT/TauT family transport system substrate-binding protein
MTLVLWLWGSIVLGMLSLGCSPADPGRSADGASATNAPGPVLHFIHDWVPEPEHGGYYAAKLKGLWKEEGVSVDVLVGGPNSEIEKRVALDPFGLGIVRGDAVFVAVERGLPVITVNAYFQHDPQGIMVREDSPVRGFADLEDRDIAMQIGASWLLYLQKKYDLKRVRVRPVTGNVANFVKDPQWITHQRALLRVEGGGPIPGAPAQRVGLRSVPGHHRQSATGGKAPGAGGPFQPGCLPRMAGVLP